jgi:DNA primase
MAGRLRLTAGRLRLTAGLLLGIAADRSRSVALYTDDSKERVRDAIDMVDLVSTRTELRRTGANAFSGLCPFHDERTPSFSINPLKKVYYCFGCQAQGDAFNFVMETEAVDFKGALELLADRYAVQLELAAEDPAEAQRRKQRERLLELLDRTSSYYERYLWESDEAAKAREYLAARGLEEAMLREFRVGFSPSRWDRVLLASRSGGFSNRELYDAGLAQRGREGRLYDRFRARIMFPLADVRGRVRGFGARVIDGGEQPKYVNSSENAVYHKGRHLFGAHLARAHAAKAGAVILCEGYTDVIALHQAGLRQAVGQMGTALTEEQVAELGRMATTVIMALDSDRAGQDAMLRAARMAERRNIDLRVVPLPEGADPAEIVQREGASRMQELVDSAVAFVRFRVERILAAGDVSTAEGRDRMLDELRPVFAEMGPSAMRDELRRVVQGVLGVSDSVAEALLRGGGDRARRGGDAATRTSQRPGGGADGDGGDGGGGGGGGGGVVTVPRRRAAVLDRREETERTFLALCIALPERGRRALTEMDIGARFMGELTRAAAQYVREHLDDPGPGVEDPRLAGMLAELSVRAETVAEERRTSLFDIEELQLEMAWVERAIVSAQRTGSSEVMGLVERRNALRSEIGRALDRALEEGGGREE